LLGSTSRASREVDSSRSVICKPICGSLGSPQRRVPACFQTRTVDSLSLPVPHLLAEISSSFRDDSPLQSSFALTSRPSPFGPRLHLPRFRPSSRLHSGPSTFRETSQSLTTVRPQAFSTSRRFTPAQSFAGLFHPAATSRVHPVQGLLSTCSHPSSSEGACPHAVVTSQLTVAGCRF
jgi:hypothetical protein